MFAVCFLFFDWYKAELEKKMDVVKEICNSVAVLHEGEIIEQGPVLDIFTNPQTQVAKDFIKTSTRMDIPKSLRRLLKPKPEENSKRRIKLKSFGILSFLNI